MPPLINETGNVYRRLMVIERASNDKHNKPVWLCQCSCGNTTEVKAMNLRTGHTRSCGCLEREIHSETVKVAQMFKVEKAAEKRTRGDVVWIDGGHGYISGYWPEHPLGNGQRVYEHWHNFWIFNDAAEWVLSAKEIGATIHHINARRGDNRPENLELRWPGLHPAGWSTDDIIRVLVSQGYRVLPPE